MQFPPPLFSRLLYGGVFLSHFVTSSSFSPRVQLLTPFSMFFDTCFWGQFSFNFCAGEVSRARIFFGRATHALFKQSHTWSLVQFDHVVFVSGCFFGVGCPVNCHVLSHVHVAFFVGPISWFSCVPLTPVYFHTDLIPFKIE